MPKKKDENQTLDHSQRQKAYSNVEDSFLTCCAELSIETELPVRRIAIAVAPLFKRTFRAVEQRIHALKKDIMDGNLETKCSKEDVEKHAEIVEELDRDQGDLEPEIETAKVTIQEEKSSIQITKRHEPDILYEDFSEDDIGRVVLVTAVNIKPYGAFCREVNGNKVGLMITGMISTDYVSNVGDYVQVGDTFRVLVVKSDKYPGRTLLNAKAVGNIVRIDKRC